jgi:fused signal recognition particle receptor
MSFFKRLKEKLTGQTEEQVVESKEEVVVPQEEISDQPALVEEVIEEQEVMEPSVPVAQEVTEEVKEEIQEERVEQEHMEVAVETAVAEVEEAPKKASAWSITSKFKEGLAKTRNTFTSKVNDLVARYRKVDEDFFEELEEVLLQADVGFETVMELMDKLRFEVQRQNIKDTEGIQAIISEKLVEIYENGE